MTLPVQTRGLGVFQNAWKTLKEIKSNAFHNWIALTSLLIEYNGSFSPVASFWFIKLMPLGWFKSMFPIFIMFLKCVLWFICVLVISTVVLCIFFFFFLFFVFFFFFFFFCHCCYFFLVIVSASFLPHLVCPEGGTSWLWHSRVSALVLLHHTHLNPFMPSGLFYHNCLDQAISK